MRFVVISDTHNDHDKILMPQGDVLIHCGDFTDCGSDREIDAFYNWLLRQQYPYKIIVPGNHDSGFNQEQIKKFSSMCVVLQDSAVLVNGIKLWGSGKTTVPNGFRKTHLQFDIDEIDWKHIPTDIDILITHGPPFGICDTNFSGKHCGDKNLAHVVKEIKPKIHLFGHIHEGYGIVEQDSTFYMNASIRPHGKPIVFDF